MNEKLKLMTIVGTRPEIIRLSATIKACDKYFNQVLVHTGQNYDYTLNQVFFEDLELREPDYYLEAVGNHLGETMGNILAKSYEVLAKERPDALLILGDTNSCLAAVSAKRLKFQYSIWKRGIDVSIKMYLKKLTVKLSIMSVMLIYLIQNIADATY